MNLQKIRRRFADLCVVAATGPSLTREVAEQIWPFPTIAVNDAYHLLPFADLLYGCDRAWWDHHRGAMRFSGERWSSHGLPNNDKRVIAGCYGVHIVRGTEGEGFSFDPAVIHYGSNSGFQAINLAIHCLGGVGRVLLVGFDMRCVAGKRHFFGEHPDSMRRETDYKRWFPEFKRAAKLLPATLRVINCTPDSALTCFPMMRLEEALPN